MVKLGSNYEHEDTGRLFHTSSDYFGFTKSALSSVTQSGIVIRQ